MARKADLAEIYTRYQGPEGGGDKGTIHSYIPIYAELLKPNADLLEIGVWEGHSLAMFQEFFTGIVLGLDIDLGKVKFDVNAKLCNATNQDSVAEALGSQKFDYIIDDGSHFCWEQGESLRILWPYLKPGGIYFIEDIQGDTELGLLEDQAKKITESWVKIWDFREARFEDGTYRFDDILMAIHKLD